MSAIEVTATTPPSTPPSPSALALHVCNICRARKKACNKQLPSCGYCSKRSLSCQYKTLPLGRKEPYPTSPLRLDDILPLLHGRTHQVVTPISEASAASRVHQSPRSNLIYVDSNVGGIPVQLSDTHSSGESRSIDHDLHSEVQLVIRARGCYIDDITSRYFQGMHKWLPVISRNRFHAELVKNGTSWPADFSILLLAMFLVVWRPSPDAAIVDDRVTLRVRTKMLFAQVQAVLPPSTSLTQACLLISIFEYAHDLGDAAFVSIGLCAKMASVTGRNAHSNGKARYETEEQRNLCWGVAIYERVIASNLSAFDQPFLTAIPSIVDDLPSEFEFLDRASDHISSEHQPLAVWDKENVGNFGRLAQATYLLSRTIETTKTDDPEERQKLSSDIDFHLQQLLGVVMEQGGGIWGPFCGAIAIIINALFILHHCALDQASSGSDVGLSPESSSEALDSLTRMVINIAYAFNQNLPVIDTEVLPPMCVYLVRSVMHNFQNINDPEDEMEGRDLRELSKMLQYFNRR